MNETLKKNLTELFRKNRIVFWYDEREEYTEDLGSLNLPDVELVNLTEDNQFKVKHLLLKEQPEQKFLVYAPFKEPSYEDNWLLGVQLAYGQFRTEQSAIILNDLGLDIGCLEIIKAHNNFFKSTARVDKLRF